jgi:hypothetical protein
MAAKRDRMQQYQDIRKETGTLWGETVEYRGLTGTQRKRLMELATVTSVNGEGESSTRVDASILAPLLIVAATFDPDTGQTIFDESDPSWMDEKSAGAIDEASNVILRLSGMTKEEHKAIVKNSDATATGVGASA